MSTDGKSKKFTRRSFLHIAGLSAASAALAACAPKATEVAVPTAAGSKPTDAPLATAASPAAAASKIVRVAYTREVDVLNAFTSQMLCDIEFCMVEGLIQNNDKGEVVPILATEIPTLGNGGIVENGDGTYDITWKLQPNVKWHDGEPFTSKDVAFTWKFVSDPESQTYNSDDYRGITKVETPDDTTAVFTWDGLYGTYSNLFEAMLPEHKLGGLSVAEIVQNEEYNRSPIGTGPFKFAEWKSGEYIRIVKNDNYWRGDPYPNIDEIVFSFIPDDNTRLNALKTGEYHIGEILPVQVKDLKDNPNGKVILIELECLPALRHQHRNRERQGPVR